jgi:hypothetical protein
MIFYIETINKIIESYGFKFIFGHQVELDGGECGGAFIYVDNERQYLSQNDMYEIYNELYLLYNMFVIFENTNINLNNFNDINADDENIILELKLENKAKIIDIKLKELDIYGMTVYFIN